MLNYDRDALADRRRAVEEENRDVIIWGNDRVIRWAISIGLKVHYKRIYFKYFVTLFKFSINTVEYISKSSFLGFCK